ncbi:MAG: hypothetical protein U5K00_09630 [Melioribacteraceae bacterium]|nr:hypothetical protein [Melioribacteraceae bacterium]
MDFKAKEFGKVTVVTVYLTRATLQYAVALKISFLNNSMKRINIWLSI